MSRPLAVFGKILSAIVKSLFFSGMMFIIFFSIVTGGFPPDFHKLTKAVSNAQEMAKMPQPTVAPAPRSADLNFSAFDEEKDVIELEAYNKKRAKLGEGLFGPESPQEEEEGKIVPLRQISSEPPEDLKAQMREMQQEIFRLQQRVNELEDRAQKTR